MKRSSFLSNLSWIIDSISSAGLLSSERGEDEEDVEDEMEDAESSGAMEVRKLGEN